MDGRHRSSICSRPDVAMVGIHGSSMRWRPDVFLVGIAPPSATNRDLPCLCSCFHCCRCPGIPPKVHATDCTNEDLHQWMCTRKDYCQNNPSQRWVVFREVAERTIVIQDCRKNMLACSIPDYVLVHQQLDRSSWAATNDERGMDYPCFQPPWKTREIRGKLQPIPPSIDGKVCCNASQTLTFVWRPVSNVWLINVHYAIDSLAVAEILQPC